MNISIPTNGVEVSYSWWEVRTQWYIWKSVVDVVDSLPTERWLSDPSSWLPYTYSILNTRVEYEVAAIMEWDVSKLNLNPIGSTYANSKKLANAYVKWTYNWIMAKVQSGATTYVLAVPTIISGDTDLTDILTIQSADRLVYHWKNNLPSNYKNSQFKVNGWGFIFNPSDILVYEWTME